MTGKFQAMEAVPLTKILNLPNFHILAHRREDGVMCGHCLDFGIWAYSEQEDDATAREHVFDRLADMAFIHIIGHLRRNTADHLYDNSAPMDGEWKEYFNAHAKEKIRKLVDSYNDLLAHPEKLKKEIGEMKVFDFTNLPIESRKDLSSILEIIQELTPDKAAEAIEHILTTVKRYTMRIAA